ncbi:MbtH family protein [Streptomyces sp. NPDC001502]|uniref:MbtH family protein n=1 Tax=Streptomyces sp. NPDC001502 TaxID=3364578 RepID=UPI00368D7A1A
MSSREERYVSVVNHEEQYSIWFADRDLPAGWTAVGTEGTKQECLAHIEDVWTDLTPRSVRVASSAPEAQVPAR